MPYPVVGGFLAGIGWFLFHGSFAVMIPSFDSLALSSLFLDPLILVHWLPALLYAILLIQLTKESRHPLQWPLFASR